VNDAMIKVGGNSSKWVSKLSYSLKTPKDQDLLGFRHLKLRANDMDPSFLREILCYDILKSMGLPVSGASYVRVIINDQPVGLFLLIQPYKSKWYKYEFGGGKKLKHGQGITYHGIGGLADLSPLGDDMKDYEKYYAIVQHPDKKHGPSSYDRLLDFIDFLADAPTTADDAADTWNKHIDVESVIRK
jgi:spore coat protein CotH